MNQSELAWNPEFDPSNPIFACLRQLFGRDLGRNWPRPEQLDALLPAETRSQSGARIHFGTQSEALNALDYEQQIYDSGCVPTRGKNWHDLFNALMWSLWPRSKSALNSGHVQDRGAGNGPRSRRRDLLTLLDECGVIIVSADPDLAHANAEHDWQRLFVAERAAWGRSIDCHVLGHGLYEQCLQPHLGLTAKALHYPVPMDFFRQSLSGQLRDMDAWLARRLADPDDLRDPSCLLPLPVLGVPGWYLDNEDPTFYDNRNYFRPRPSRR